MRSTIFVLLMALLPATPGTTAHAADAVDAAGVCANCHFAESAAAGETGGHAAILDCRSCHSDKRPGRIGRGHRKIPRCTSHHETAGHPPRNRGVRKENRNCLRCHQPHGTPNLSHVRKQIRHRKRLLPITFENLAGAAPGGFTDPSDPGTGLCETCHRKTEFYRRDGTGDEHFTDSCTLCHEHDVGFEPVSSDDNCGICHVPQAERFEKPSGHSARFVCSNCHPDTGADIGPDHRASRACADCHDTATHDPPGVAAFDCTDCHEPHGTDNEYLVREIITTPQGENRPIVFDNLDGRADGSFASASDPGSGICEICHTTTSYYRADGSGAAHFTFSCLPCHLHSKGFEPQ